MQATYPHPAPFPARLEGRLERPSRWLWLVKWLLVLPHYVVLAVLWCAFAVTTLVAFVAILFTGRYPRGLFDFNVGVLRWSWRVGFYAFAANGTDRYPPFTLADDASYPARLEISYPYAQRRGLPLVGWWLVGLPQYVVAGILVGGAGSIAWTGHGDGVDVAVRSGGVIGIFTLVAAVVLLVRGTYPQGLFDLLLGLDRWVLRVVAYAAFMTREYPPFRLDPGEHEQGAVAFAPAPAAAEPARTDGWGAGRVTAVVFGSLAVLAGLVALAGGGTALVFDQTQRDASGYLMTRSSDYETDTYALVSDSYRAGTAGDWFVARDVLGIVRVRTSGERPLFVGIAPAAAVDSYLAGVRHEVAGRFDADRSGFRLQRGVAPAAPPTAERFWSATSLGSGNRTLSWTPQAGDWRIVVMNADGSAGVDASLAIGARFPNLLWMGVGALGAAALLLLLGGSAIYAAVPRGSRREEV